MSRFKQFNESLDTKVPFELNQHFMGYMSDFSVDGEKYHMDISKLDQYGMTYEIIFVKMQKGNDYTHDITGDSKNPLKVFGAVSNIFKEFIEKEKPHRFLFSAKQKSRIRLYDRLSNMIASKFGYRLKIEDFGGEKQYVFEK